MDFNLKALGAETVMVDRRLAARLVEAELLLRDGEKLPYAEELNQFIRQNSEFPAQAGMLRNEDFFNVFNVFNVEIPMIRSHILL